MNEQSQLTIEVVQLIRGRGHMAFGALYGPRPRVGDVIELLGRNGLSYPGTVRSVEFSNTPGIERPGPEQIGLGINGPAAAHLVVGLVIRTTA